MTASSKPLFSDLPVVITGPGDYVTRDGRRVTIHEIRPAADAYVTGFNAKGAVWCMYRGVMRPRGYDIWHISGRYRPVLESPLDITGPWVAESQS